MKRSSKPPKTPIKPLRGL